MVVWWKGTRGLHSCQPTWVHRRPEITPEFPPSLNPTWTFHFCAALFPSLCLLASSAMQGIKPAADVIFHLQHSCSLHKCLLGAPLKEPSQGWNCAKPLKGCLLPYYFYSIWFLATIACFWECTKWQSRTSFLMSCVFYFTSEELRRAVPHAIACLFYSARKWEGLSISAAMLCFSWGSKKSYWLYCCSIFPTYILRRDIQGESYGNVWEEKNY